MATHRPRYNSSAHLDEKPRESSNGLTATAVDSLLPYPVGREGEGQNELGVTVQRSIVSGGVWVHVDTFDFISNRTVRNAVRISDEDAIELAKELKREAKS